MTNIDCSVFHFLSPTINCKWNLAGLRSTDLELHFFAGCSSTSARTPRSRSFLAYSHVVHVFSLETGMRGYLVVQAMLEGTLWSPQPIAVVAHSWDNPTVNHNWTVFFTISSDIFNEVFWQQEVKLIVERFSESCLNFDIQFWSVEAVSPSFSFKVVNAHFHHGPYEARFGYSTSHRCRKYLEYLEGQEERDGSGIQSSWKSS